MERHCTYSSEADELRLFLTATVPKHFVGALLAGGKFILGTKLTISLNVSSTESYIFASIPVIINK